MRILSLDQDSRSTGFCFFINGDLDAYGLLESELGHVDMAQQVWHLLLEFEPDLLAVEGVYAGKNYKVHGLLSELKGILRYMATMAGCDFCEITTAEADRAMHSKYVKGGRKETLQRMAKLETGDDLGPHVADAYYVGRAAIVQRKQEGWLA